MGGGIMQLTANGEQDNYITGNPQITYFKSVYRKHTNFAIESIQQIMDGKLGTEETATSSTIKISKSADLLNKVYIVCPQTKEGINGSELISNVYMIIGGTKVDYQTNEWMKVWNELTISNDKCDGYRYMSGSGFPETISGIDNKQSCVMVPLLFWFCRHIGLSLPLIALQYHDIIIKIEWGINSKINRDGNSNRSSICEVWTDNIFLDTDERKRFGENSHEYLIEQVQIIDTINQSPDTKFKMNSFNHLVKEIIWVEKEGEEIDKEKVNITLNGIERISEQYKEYYTLLQPYNRHTNIPSYNIKEYGNPEVLIDPISMGQCTYDTNSSFVYDNQKPLVGDTITIEESGKGITGIHTITGIDIDSSIVTFIPPSSEGGVGQLTSRIISRRYNPRSKYSNYKKNIYVYSFCLNPEEHQPSGTCNFSTLNDSKIVYTTSVSIDKIFAFNYNILRISNGLSSLVYTQ